METNINICVYRFSMEKIYLKFSQPIFTNSSGLKHLIAHLMLHYTTIIINEK